MVRCPLKKATAIKHICIVCYSRLRDHVLLVLLLRLGRLLLLLFLLSLGVLHGVDEEVRVVAEAGQPGAGRDEAQADAHALVDVVPARDFGMRNQLRRGEGGTGQSAFESVCCGEGW